MKMLSNRVFVQSAIIGLVSSVLVGCASYRPEKFDCSNRLSAPLEGIRADISTQQVDEVQPVAVRLNGVSAECYVKNEMIVMDVDAGLKVSRNLKEGLETARVQVPILISKIDNNDKPYDAKSVGFAMAFDKNKDTLYPVVEFQLKLEKDARAVMALTPQIVETD